MTLDANMGNANKDNDISHFGAETGGSRHGRISAFHIFDPETTTWAQTRKKSNILNVSLNVKTLRIGEAGVVSGRVFCVSLCCERLEPVPPRRFDQTKHKPTRSPQN